MARSLSRGRHGSLTVSHLHPQVSRSAHSNHSSKSLSRVFSGHHIDDVSIYHGDDELCRSRHSLVEEERKVPESTGSSGSVSPSSQKDLEKALEGEIDLSEPPRDPNIVLITAVQ